MSTQGARNPMNSTVAVDPNRISRPQRQPFERKSVRRDVLAQVSRTDLVPCLS